MFDLFNLLLLSMVLLVVGFIVFAIRKTLSEISKPGLSGDEARKLAQRIRQRDIRCPGCNRQSSALLGTDTKYKCDTCNYEFDGPNHMPEL